MSFTYGNAAAEAVTAMTRLSLTIGASLTGTANMANQIGEMTTRNQKTWTEGDPSDHLTDLGDGDSLPANLTDGLFPLSTVPAGTNTMFYTNSQVQKQINYIASLAAKDPGDKDKQAQYQMAIQAWTNSGQLSTSKSTQEQTSLNNTQNICSTSLQSNTSSKEQITNAASAATDLNKQAAGICGSLI